MNKPTLPELPAACTAELKNICDCIYQNPETGFQEFKAVQLLTTFLANNGFDITEKYMGIKTAFKAECGSGSPEFCIMAEYDALPELGHACGHNLIATAAITAAVIARKEMIRNRLPGKLILMGTPAEEAEGGKIEILKRDGFNNIDACILCHPGSHNGIPEDYLAVSRREIIFHGKAAHAAAAPEDGVNALDAMNLLFAGVGAWRQQMPQSTMVHGVITDGGAVANIIPDYTRAFFYIRSLSNHGREQADKRLHDIVKGAALMTGCRYKFNLKTNTYDAARKNTALDEFAAAAMQRAGLAVEKMSGRISTDYCNVSQVIPGCNIFFKAPENATEIPLHSKEFQIVAGTEYAFEQCLKAGQVMAATAVEFLKNQEFREAVKSSFDSSCE
ncbi:M20 family metallopeptidase [Lentisphaerota bacterium ZTH]|nr:M20 family metallopeptidase [Lentisphaerota bacterium]WET06756.1 M20 family metallopeptidase [Lentisphaerota bacterium ZTH]